PGAAPEPLPGSATSQKGRHVLFAWARLSRRTFPVALCVLTGCTGSHHRTYVDPRCEPTRFECLCPGFLEGKAPGALDSQLLCGVGCRHARSASYFGAGRLRPGKPEISG